MISRAQLARERDESLRRRAEREARERREREQQRHLSPRRVSVRFDPESCGDGRRAPLRLADPSRLRRRAK